jgi:hypothetical protein
MRSVGLGLALVASVQYLFAATPAFAQDPPAKASQTAAAPAPAPLPPAAATTTTTTTATAAASGAQTTTITTTTPATPSGQVAPVVAVAAAPNTVTVHLNSPKPVSLERRASSGSAWEYVCTSPCDASVSLRDEYHIVGENLNSSKPFVLDGSQGDKITLDVTPGVHKKAQMGKWVLLGGGILVVGGVIMLVGGSRSNDVPGNGGAVTTNTNDDWIFAGTAVIVAGVIAGITGGSFLVDNAHTKVDGAIGAVPDRDRKTDVKLQVQVTGERGPTWHEDRGPHMAAVHSVPLLQAHF